MTVPQQEYRRRVSLHIPPDQLARHCVACGQVFWVQESALVYGYGKYCSKECWDSIRRNLILNPLPKEDRRAASLRMNMRKYVEFHPNSYRNRRRALIKYLGGKCAWCGYSDIRALELDHLRGGGNRARKAIKGGSIKEISELSKAPEKAKEIYQVLCANCNRIKAEENHERFLYPVDNKGDSDGNNL